MPPSTDSACATAPDSACTTAPERAHATSVRPRVRSRGAHAPGGVHAAGGAHTGGGAHAGGGVRAPGGAHAVDGASTSVAPAERERGLQMLQVLAAVERFPALADARDDLLTALRRKGVAASEIAAIVEKDAALTMTVLREANRGCKQRERVDAIVPAVERVGAARLQELVQAMAAFDLLRGGGAWGELPARFRMHALLTQRAAEAIAGELGCRQRDRLAVASLLHDVGKVAMALLHPRYVGRLCGARRGGLQGVRGERSEFGVDHGLMGGLLARRWDVPPALAHAIERHHDADAQGEAAIVGLADMLVHHQREANVRPDELTAAADALGLDRDGLRRIVRGQAMAQAGGTRRAEHCPLTNKEQLVLQRLGEGLVYKQIAARLGVSASVVRTHLHNIYAKLGVRDRAQAVLLANGRGWL
ncbi:MAG TPA: HDOD domain-containing protein [Solirubrobacteraceae bacterium]|nr:HDOD domain-containing protein [Solirubrobacteraceae bacterium]